MEQQQQQQALDVLLLLRVETLLADESEELRGKAAIAVAKLGAEEKQTYHRMSDALLRAALKQLAQQPAAAAAPAPTTTPPEAAIQVHRETVELSIEGSGAPLSMKAPLINGKVHVCAIEKALAAKRLNLVTINGTIPVPDSGGFSQETYSPGDTLTIEAAPKPGVKVATAYAHAAPKSRLLSLWT